jgi:hypothetical protein
MVISKYIKSDDLYADLKKSDDQFYTYSKKNLRFGVKDTDFSTVQSVSLKLQRLTLKRGLQS